MQYLQQDFTIRYQYKVFFTADIFNTSNNLLASYFNEVISVQTPCRVLAVIDSGVIDAHPYLVQQLKTYFANLTTVHLASELVIVPGGEVVKVTDEYLNQVIDAVNHCGIDRHSYIIAIGGGAVLDMVGYAAAIAHRGVKLIRVPTTVLSQNDSGVGVKNGINFLNKKNFLGTFATPVAVFNDERFLTTLDNRNWRAGIAEAIKVALIKDAVFFGWLEQNAVLLAQRDREAMNWLVFRCAQLHMEHIAGADPFERGSSRPLDFGHWGAHKMEQLTHFELLHGEAVAIGIALDSIYSHKAGYLPAKDLARIIQLLLQLGFDLVHPVLQREAEIYQGIEEFREHLGGQLTIMLLTEIGKGINVHEISKALFGQSVQLLVQENLAINHE